jgi:rhodanese-related sulfurtransferase
MKETYKTKRLSVASVIFVAIIIIGLLTARQPEFEYKLTPLQTLEAIQQSGKSASPQDVAGYIKANDKSFVYVDLRSPYDFIKGNIQGSLNIPANRILEKESLAFFKKCAAGASTVLLYDEDQSLANGPWMLLLQLGYDNVKVMQGGWDCFTEMNTENIPDKPDWLVENPKYNYAGIKASMGQNTTAGNTPEPKEVLLPQRKVKKKKVEGGC